jgi:anti-anti-sigma factor
VSLEIDLEEIEQRVILRLEGRLDASTSAILEKKLDKLVQEKHHQLLLDFSGIDYMSSAGLRLLLSFSKKLHSLKGSLALFSLSSEVEEIVKMAGFDRILLLFANEKEALQHRTNTK